MKLDLTTTPNFCKYKQITLSTVDNVKKKNTTCVCQGFAYTGDGCDKCDSLYW